MNGSKFKGKPFLGYVIALAVPFLLTSCGPESPVIEVVFDGEDCIANGPNELQIGFPAGEVKTVFIDESGLGGELWIVSLQPGWTFQDHLDLHEPGVHVDKPDWASYVFRVDGKSETYEEARMDRETWKVDQVGEYVILCYVSYPQMLWTAAPLRVVE